MTLPISATLRNARKERKLTQRQLADRIGVKYTTYSNWENEHSTPSPSMIATLADALQVTTDYLLGREPMTTAEQTKLDTLAERIEQYRAQIQVQLDYFIEQHNYYLTLIDQSGFNDADADPILLGPGILSRIRNWYSLASIEAYGISGKSRDLQKFYLAVSEQGKSNQYELVRLGKYDAKMNNATDAKEISRRVGGRLEEKAAYWEGEYLRWQGAGDGYDRAANSVKDMFELAMAEWKLKH